MKFGLVVDKAVVAFLLPEGLVGEAENLVALFAGVPFERLHYARDVCQRSYQEMDVVWHHDVAVEFAGSLVPVVKRFDYDCGEFRGAKKCRAGAGVIELAVESDQGFSGGYVRGEGTACWEGAVQTPGDEDGTADAVQMRQATAVYSGHEMRVAFCGKVL